MSRRDAPDRVERAVPAAWGQSVTSQQGEGRSTARQSVIQSDSQSDSLTVRQKFGQSDSQSPSTRERGAHSSSWGYGQATSMTNITERHYDEVQNTVLTKVHIFLNIATLLDHGRLAVYVGTVVNTRNRTSIKMRICWAKTSAQHSLSEYPIQ